MDEMKGKMFSFIVLFQLFYLCFAPHCTAEIIDRIVAIVNDEIITLSEIKRMSALMMNNAAAGTSGMNKNQMQEMASQVLGQLIEKKLIAQEAKKQNIQVSEDELNDTVNVILERNKIDLSQLEEALKKEGTTLEQYLEVLRSEILQNQIVGKEIQSRITITDKDIEEYYNRKIKPNEKPGEKVRIQQILLRITPNNTPENIETLWQQLEEIREKILSGQSFGQLAVQYSQGPSASQGGDLGYFSRGELLPSIEEAAFGMEKDQISQVIKTAVGLHLIKILDKQTGQEKEGWKSRKREIEDILFRQEVDKRYKEWMEELKKNAFIEINL
jgi:peptidyl-prolyl cis-trans isomerase SurA